MKNKLLLFSAIGWVILMSSAMGEIERTSCDECGWEMSDE